MRLHITRDEEQLALEYHYQRQRQVSELWAKMKTEEIIETLQIKGDVEV